MPCTLTIVPAVAAGKADRTVEKNMDGAVKTPKKTMVALGAVESPPQAGVVRS